MSRKPLTQKELEKIVHDMFEEPEANDEDYFPSSDSEFSEEEIEQQAEESVTEQENTSDESEEEETNEEFFIGKNKTTQWRKTTYRAKTKTKSINVVAQRSGLTQRAHGIENELNALSQIIDMSMIDNVLRYTNMYIDRLRVDHQYLMFLFRKSK
ncbi:uncharacterized protein LOC123306718 [Coccinella septempunctata]|uniref:uncharacterized protein LOC123306718 n=1 Tax=Coccinella septempunctata TaxID=41139 RepID=UPI001D06F30F|nr:uncharacterized protein LOC123306718 [Coccinella septempunctata]